MVFRKAGAYGRPFNDCAKRKTCKVSGACGICPENFWNKLISVGASSLEDHSMHQFEGWNLKVPNFGFWVRPVVEACTFFVSTVWCLSYSRCRAQCTLARGKKLELPIAIRAKVEVTLSNRNFGLQLTWKKYCYCSQVCLRRQRLPVALLYPRIRWPAPFRG